MSKPKFKWRILARHKWLEGMTITESVREPHPPIGPSYRRFTATIRGFQNFRLCEGRAGDVLVRAARHKALSIRSRIDEGDESVFHEPNVWDYLQPSADDLAREG